MFISEMICNILAGRVDKVRNVTVDSVGHTGDLLLATCCPSRNIILDALNNMSYGFILMSVYKLSSSIRILALRIRHNLQI